MAKKKKTDFEVPFLIPKAEKTNKQIDYAPHFDEPLTEKRGKADLLWALRQLTEQIPLLTKAVCELRTDLARLDEVVKLIAESHRATTKEDKDDRQLEITNDQLDKANTKLTATNMGIQRRTQR